MCNNAQAHDAPWRSHGGYLRSRRPCQGGDGRARPTHRYHAERVRARGTPPITQTASCRGHRQRAGLVVLDLHGGADRLRKLFPRRQQLLLDSGPRGDGNPAGPGVELGVRSSRPSQSMRHHRRPRVPQSASRNRHRPPVGRGRADSPCCGRHLHRERHAQLAGPHVQRGRFRYRRTTPMSRPHHVPDTPVRVPARLLRHRRWYTVGPITALSSPDSSGNGVYCYGSGDPAHCAVFPREHLPRHQLLGHAVVGIRLRRVLPAGRQRADPGQLAKAGKRDPGEVQPRREPRGLDIFRTGYREVTTVSCSTQRADGTPSEPRSWRQAASLQYDPTTSQYSATSGEPARAGPGHARSSSLGLNDGARTFLPSAKVIDP